MTGVRLENGDGRPVRDGIQDGATYDGRHAGHAILASRLSHLGFVETGGVLSRVGGCHGGCERWTFLRICGTGGFLSKKATFLELQPTFQKLAVIHKKQAGTLIS